MNEAYLIVTEEQLAEGYEVLLSPYCPIDDATEIRSERRDYEVLRELPNGTFAVKNPQSRHTAHEHLDRLLALAAIASQATGKSYITHYFMPGDAEALWAALEALERVVVTNAN